MSPSLPDILEADLNIVFVGINPGFNSAKVGHYYAHKANRFWPMLYQSTLLPAPLGPHDDWKLPRFRMGFTDLVKRVTAGSSELSTDELENGGEILQKKIAYYRPRIVCFIGLLSYRSLFGQESCPGPTQHKIHNSHLFSIPSTSPRNTLYSNERLLFWFTQLKNYQRELGL